jgi:hypothetical protein
MLVETTKLSEKKIKIIYINRLEIQKKNDTCFI